MTDTDRTDRVLVVDDEAAYTDLLAAWLEADYAVETATSGREALDALDALDSDVDVVLLDRRMPGLSGNEVLERLDDMDCTCGVAMVTAVEPSFDVVDMGFDDYLVKPISRERLRDVVDALLDRTAYEERVQELFSLASKKAVLEERHTRTELESSAEYARLDERFARTFEELDGVLGSLSETEYEELFRQFEG
ncbi:MAG: response regulator [Haloferacaceae archaeon]